MNETGNDAGSVTDGLPDRRRAEDAAYEGLMRAKEAYRAEAHRLARELADAKEALRPFAELADVCDHFTKMPDERICSWRIAGERKNGPTADDCRRAKRAYGSLIEPLVKP